MEKNLPEIGKKIYQLWGLDLDISKCEPAWVKIITTDDKDKLQPYATRLGTMYCNYNIVTLSVEKTKDLKKGLRGKELLRATMNYILDHPDDYAACPTETFIGIALKLSGEDSPLSDIANFYTQLLSISLPQYHWLERSDNKGVYALSGRTILETYVFVANILDKDKDISTILPKL